MCAAGCAGKRQEGTNCAISKGRGQQWAWRGRSEEALFLLFWSAHVTKRVVLRSSVGFSGTNSSGFVSRKLVVKTRSQSAQNCLQGRGHCQPACLQGDQDCSKCSDRDCARL